MEITNTLTHTVELNCSFEDFLKVGRKYLYEPEFFVAGLDDNDICRITYEPISQNEVFLRIFTSNIEEANNIALTNLKNMLNEIVERKIIKEMPEIKKVA